MFIEDTQEFSLMGNIKISTDHFSVLFKDWGSQALSSSRSSVANEQASAGNWVSLLRPVVKG